MACEKSPVVCVKRREQQIADGVADDAGLLRRGDAAADS